MNRLVAVTLALMLTVSLTGCAGDSTATEARPERPPLPPERQSQPASGPRPVTMVADHAVYNSASALLSNATVVAFGTVLATSQTVQLINDGIDTVELPRTAYTVKVNRVVQGDIALLNTEIPVVLAGGLVDGELYRLEGGPVLATGQSYTFFLRKGADSSYYPLAGGAAIGGSATGDVTLSSEVTGGTPLTLKTEALAPTFAVTIKSVSVRKRDGKREIRLRGTWSGAKVKCGQSVSVLLSDPFISVNVPGSRFKRLGDGCRTVSKGRVRNAVRVNSRTRTFDIKLYAKSRPAIGHTANFILRFGRSEANTSLNWS